MSLTYYSSNEEVELLAKKFENRILPKEQWTHQAHLTVGLYHLYHHSFHETLCLMKAKIMAYNESVGTANSPTSGYHETLTVFWLRVLDDFLKGKRSQPLCEACNSFLDSPLASRELPLRYYSKEKLFSVEARATWVEGNLIQDF